MKQLKAPTTYERVSNKIESATRSAIVWEISMQQIKQTNKQPYFIDK
jgi:hypothetical protein